MSGDKRMGVIEIAAEVDSAARAQRLREQFDEIEEAVRSLSRVYPAGAYSRSVRKAFDMVSEDPDAVRKVAEIVGVSLKAMSAKVREQLATAYEAEAIKLRGAGA